MNIRLCFVAVIILFLVWLIDSYPLHFSVAVMIFVAVSLHRIYKDVYRGNTPRLTPPIPRAVVYPKLLFYITTTIV